MALLCLALVGVFVWLVVIPFFRHRLTTHVAALTPGNLDNWTVPPILFVDEDLQPLSQRSDLSWHDLRGLLDARLIETLPARLQEVVPEHADVLIVYATAQGISRDGEACLLCTDEDSRISGNEPNQRRSVYPVRDLLRRLGELNVPLKLLVLDFGNLVSDPRMGMVVNEFPVLLAQAVAEQTDQRLWVLASHSVGEASYASAQQRHSVFGRSLASGLAGQADADDLSRRDGFVSLWELYRHVTVECRQATGGRQTPLLLRSGPSQPSRRAAAQQLRLVQVRTTKGERPLEEPPSPVVHPPAEAPPTATKPSNEQPRRASSTARLCATRARLHGARTRAARTRSRTRRTRRQSRVSRPVRRPRQPHPRRVECPARSVDRERPHEPEPGRGCTGRIVMGRNVWRCRLAVTLIAAATLTGCRRSEPAPSSDPEPPQVTPTGTAAAVSLLPRDLGQDLEQAWTLRDQLQQPGTDDTAWIPAEYAPHLWRRLNARLLDLDLRARGGAAFDKQAVSNVVREYSSGLQGIGGQPSLSEGTDVLRRLTQAAVDFHSPAEMPRRSSFRAESPELQEIGRYARGNLRRSTRPSICCAGTRSCACSSPPAIGNSPI